MGGLRRWVARWPRWAKWWGGLLVVPSLYVVGRIIDGFIGNRGDAIIVAALDSTSAISVWRHQFQI